MFKIRKDLGKEMYYALEIQHVREIRTAGHITRVPRAPRQVTGVINLRGKVVPIIDIRRSLGLSSGIVSSPSPFIIIAEMGGITIGLMVEEVEMALRPLGEDLEPALNQADERTPYARGTIRVRERSVPLLELQKVLLPSGSEPSDLKPDASVMGS